MQSKDQKVKNLLKTLGMLSPLPLSVSLCLSFSIFFSPPLPYNLTVFKPELHRCYNTKGLAVSVFLLYIHAPVMLLLGTPASNSRDVSVPDVCTWGQACAEGVCMESRYFFEVVSNSKSCSSPEPRDMAGAGVCSVTEGTKLRLPSVTLFCGAKINHSVQFHF